MLSRPGRITLGYVTILTCSFLAAMAAGWSPLAGQIDGSAYDWLFRLQPPEPRPPSSVILAIDEVTLAKLGGSTRRRSIVADGLMQIQSSRPRVIAIDLILADEIDPVQDAALEAALKAMPAVVLASDLIPNTDAWEEPLARFRRHADAVGHAHAEPDPVSRVLPLVKIGGRDRRWAIALEALRLWEGASLIEESPDDLRAGRIRIPAAWKDARELHIRYLPRDRAGRSRIPVVSFAELKERPEVAETFAGKAVFVGMTAVSLVRDRLMTPYGMMMSGVEIHAHAFETMVSGLFLREASNVAVVAGCLLITAAAGLTFAFLSGWAAYAVGGALVFAAHVLPHAAFSQNVIFPYLAPVLAAWLSTVSAASWRHFVVRRQLQKAESDKSRYQQAIHFVTHEMRSPLTAIQGSSELMGRYNLNDEKRKQIAQMINTESKRLARMIQTFLDIERLTDGQMEIRAEPFAIEEVLEACLQRTQVLADRKQIAICTERLDRALLSGDRELMEYAVYNLLTNAVKYSPAETTVTIRAYVEGPNLRLSVSDQGIGMDEKELRNIFKKFYRTRKAEASGEVGTGIGLSIVEQIVAHHHGRMEVISAPGKGSCFTMVLPRESSDLTEGNAPVRSRFSAAPEPRTSASGNAESAGQRPV
ncbi:MAG: CHASE2 domain-containing protein [Bryobacteraceae bacterium]